MKLTVFGWGEKEKYNEEMKLAEEGDEMNVCDCDMICE